jgi:hypothetical protein
MVFVNFFVLISRGLQESHKNLGIKQSPPAESPMGGRHTYNRVLFRSQKESFVTLLSPPQCHEALGTMPHILASVDQNSFCGPRELPAPRQGRVNSDFAE